MSSNKRASLDYDFTPQMKRLSFDEAQEYKQSVYDRTIKLLYKGAKFRPTVASEVSSPGIVKNAQNSNRKKLKQILIDNNGRLDNQHVIFNSKEYCPSIAEKCSFCERLKCFTTLYQCFKCHDHFCGNCSLFKYSENEEVPLCLTCFK